MASRLMLCLRWIANQRLDGARKTRWHGWSSRNEWETDSSRTKPSVSVPARHARLFCLCIQTARTHSINKPNCDWQSSRADSLAYRSEPVAEFSVGSALTRCWGNLHTRKHRVLGSDASLQTKFGTSAWQATTQRRRRRYRRTGFPRTFLQSTC